MLTPVFGGLFRNADIGERRVSSEQVLERTATVMPRASM